MNKPFDFTGVDRVAQGNIGKAAIDADIANGGEAASKLHPRGHGALEDRVRLAVLERRSGIAFGHVDRPVGEMGMEIDQTGKDGEARPIDRGRAIGVAPR